MKLESVFYALLNQANKTILDVAEREEHQGHYWLNRQHYYFLLKAAGAFSIINSNNSTEENEYWERLMWFRLFCMESSI